MTSCRQSDHHPSLNDCLLIGPPQQNDICVILLRFRCHAIRLSTDIEYRLFCMWDWMKQTEIIPETLAIKYYKEAWSIMKFNLRSWVSNSNQVQALAMNDEVADKDSTVNILGLRWNLSSDTITFAMKYIAPDVGSTNTKREVLQQSSRLYNPLGFLAPVTVQAKILLQELKMELPRQFFTAVYYNCP